MAPRAEATGVFLVRLRAVFRSGFRLDPDKFLAIREFHVVHDVSFFPMCPGSQINLLRVRKTLCASVATSVGKFRKFQQQPYFVGLFSRAWPCTEASLGSQDMILRTEAVGMFLMPRVLATTLSFLVRFRPVKYGIEALDILYTLVKGWWTLVGLETARSNLGQTLVNPSQTWSTLVKLGQTLGNVSRTFFLGVFDADQPSSDQTGLVRALPRFACRHPRKSRVYDLAVIENTRTNSLDQDQIGGGEPLDTMVAPTIVVMNFSIEKKVCVFLPHAGTYVQPRSIDDMTQPITKKRGPTKNDDDDASTTPKKKHDSKEHHEEERDPDVIVVGDNFKPRVLNSRCALDRVRRLFAKFDEAKKETIRYLGFASWLNTSHSVLLTLEQVGCILGLCTSGPLITYEEELKDIKLLCEKHGFHGIETVMLGSLECALGAKDGVVDAGFKKKLVLFILATVFYPKTSLNIHMGYLHVVKDIDRVSGYNWALFVFNKLQDVVIVYKLHSNKTYICGCIYFLQIRKSGGLLVCTSVVITSTHSAKYVNKAKG
uniref:Aminotransferase-like plant mobile domain-containing protein n=1 Tax=Fagus sylvatica TaxID=28930 RepID=A0A2N9ITB3_FAGSY